jgi:hypothetical protein
LERSGRQSILFQSATNAFKIGSQIFVEQLRRLTHQSGEKPLKIRLIVSLLVLGMAASGCAYFSGNAEDGSKPGPALASAGNPGAPALEVPEWYHNFGNVVEGADYRHAFVVRNKGTGTLEIKEVRHGCGTSVASYDKTIPPGAEGKIVLQLHPSSFRSGKKSRSLVLTNDPRVPRFTMEVQGQLTLADQPFGSTKEQ